ncbi:MAG: trypsin-like peptidase domain-containing protein [Pseudonocardia sp.]|nr:trypsin-like peptidase domain-containing protein [Pseudonocardia sp.]
MDNPESAPGNASPDPGTQPDPPSAPEPTADHASQPSAGQYQPAPDQPAPDQPGPDQPDAGSARPGYGQDYGPPAFGHQAYGQPGYGAGPPTATLPAVGGPQPRGGSGLGAVAAVGLVAALLGGGVGGYVGYESARAAGTGSSIGVLAEPLPPVDPNATPLSPVESIAARVLPSVVQLQVQGVRAVGEGSGIVMSADGLLLTNNHVVEAAANGGKVVALFQDGTSAPAQIVGRDPSSDLAVLRAQGVSGLTPVALGNSDSLRVGQQVVAFGAPLGLGGTVTTGIISALNRAVSVGQESGASEATVLSAVQTDAAINPGNSGGPLVDMQGALIGINSAIATTGAQGGSIGVGFAIPINQAKRVAEELERTGRATRAVLGVALTADARTSTGATIGQVTPGGPAEQAGLRAGEVVTRVDDRLVTNGNELVAAIRDHAPGDRITLTVDGRQVQVTLSGQSG